MSEHLNVTLPDDFLEVFFSHLKYAIPEKNEKLVNSIRALAEKYELVLLTNYFSESQMNRLNGMGIGQFFKYCYGENLIKPNQDAYINACGKHRTDECVMIGDNLERDIKGALNAGLNAVYYNPKHRKFDVECIEISKIKDLRNIL